MGQVFKTQAEEVYLINCGLIYHNELFAALSENLKVLDISENDKMVFGQF